MPYPIRRRRDIGDHSDCGFIVIRHGREAKRRAATTPPVFTHAEP
jgi:hypothetical protein